MVENPTNPVSAETANLHTSFQHVNHGEATVNEPAKNLSNHTLSRMSSKALLTKARPHLFHRIEGPRAVEVWTTTCIVTAFAEANCSLLVNPSNEYLTGTSQFPYFPRGGPVPAQPPRVSAHHIMGFVSQWGGMEVGGGMLFPVSVVDGLVHLHGGPWLQLELQALRWRAWGAEVCPVGAVVRTSAGQGRLRLAYEAVLHTTPPFYRYHDEPEHALQQCYQSVLAKVANEGPLRIATPLLGAGARGFDRPTAMAVAARAGRAWRQSGTAEEQTLVFGLLERQWAEKLVEALES